MSFSGNPDELGQWRGYGSNGLGCSVETTVAELRGVADVAGWVIYDPKKQNAFAYKVLQRLRRVANRNEIAQALIAAACFMKYGGFSPEQEFRLLKFPQPSAVSFRETGDRLVPFIDYLAPRHSISIPRVLIGPGWQLANVDSPTLAKHHVAQGIQRLLTARRLHTTDLESSKIPYDPR